MNGKRRPLGALACLLLVLSAGCASSRPEPVDLTATAAARPLADFASTGEAAELPFESVTRGQLQVECNLQREPLTWGGRIWVRLLFRNRGTEPMTLTPELRLVDGSELDIARLDRDAFVDEQRAAPAPEVTDHPAEDVAGAATTISPLAGFFGLGPLGPIASLTEMVVSATTDDRVIGPDGSRRASWAMTHWLPPVLELPPGGSRAGIAGFANPRSLPLKLTVLAGGESFVFRSRSPSDGDG